MYYFINADDFGMTKSITDAIDVGIRSGQIQRTSLVMNGEATEYAIDLCRKGGYEDRVCFHLNLANGTPLTSELRESSYCNAEGNMNKLQRTYAIKKGVQLGIVKALRTESEAQMKLFREAGFSSKHIDSHKWFICTWPVWKAIKPIVREYGFETTRPLSGGRLPFQKTVYRVYYSFVFNNVRGVLREVGEWSGSLNDLERDVANGSIGENSFAEIYVHPDMIDGIPTDRYYSHDLTAKPIDEVARIAKELGELRDTL